MHRFIEGQDRARASFLPASLEDYVDADNTARVIEAFIEALDLGPLGFAVEPAATGRPSYHPAMMLKLYIYGYLNRIQSSRRLERECRRRRSRRVARAQCRIIVRRSSFKVGTFQLF